MNEIVDFVKGNFLTCFEIFAAIMGFCYVLLEVLQKRSMWILNLITATCYIALYLYQGLYAMMTIQFYYIVVSSITLVQWGREARLRRSGVGSGEGSGGGDVVIIRKMSLKIALLSAVVALAVFFGIGLVFDHFTDNPRPYVDSLVATLSMLATFWLAKRYLENWYVWIVCNVIGVYLFFTQSMYPTAILYIIYIAMCIFGIYHWRRKGVRE